MHGWGNRCVAATRICGRHADVRANQGEIVTLTQPGAPA